MLLLQEALFMDLYSVARLSVLVFEVLTSRSGCGNDFQPLNLTAHI